MTAGVIKITSRKNGAVRDVRRMAALERAAVFVGAGTLAYALDIGPRLLRAKIAAERPIHDDDLRLAAEAVRDRVRAADELAARLSSLISEQATS